MKNTLLLALMIFCASAGAQTFRFAADGSTDFMVRFAGHRKAIALYSSAEKWIRKNNHNEQNVFRSHIQGKSITFAGILPSVIQRQGTTYDAAYLIELHFKNGKYRVRYLHQSLLQGKKRAALTLDQALSEKPSAENHWRNPKLQYEAAVNKLLNSLHRSMSD